MAMRRLFGNFGSVLVARSERLAVVVRRGLRHCGSLRQFGAATAWMMYVTFMNGGMFRFVAGAPASDVGPDDNSDDTPV